MLRIEQNGFSKIYLRDTILSKQHPQLIDWRMSEPAAQYFDCERPYLQSALRQAAGPAVLQVGELLESKIIEDLDLPFLLKSAALEGAHGGVADLCADPAFLPFSEKTLSTVLLPHVLEGHCLPHQVLREAHRVLQSEGHLVLTGFNPISLIGVQSKFAQQAVPQGRYYTSRRVVDWLQLLGFEVIANASYQYPPLTKRLRLRKALNFLETVGDRWLPMLGGAYMITAKKKDLSMTMIGRVKYRKSKRKLVAAPAKASLRSKNKQS